MIRWVAFFILLSFSLKSFSINIDGISNDWNGTSNFKINFNNERYRIKVDEDSIYILLERRSNFVPIQHNGLIIPIFSYKDKIITMEFYNSSKESLGLKPSLTSKDNTMVVFLSKESRLYNFNSGLGTKHGYDEFLVSENGNIVEIKIKKNNIEKGKNNVRISFIDVNVDINYEQPKDGGEQIRKSRDIGGIGNGSIDINSISVMQQIKDSIDDNVNTQVNGFVSAEMSVGAGGEVTMYAGQDGFNIHGGYVANAGGSWVKDSVKNTVGKGVLSVSAGFAFGDLDAMTGRGRSYNLPFIGVGRTVDANGDLTLDAISIYVHDDIIPSITDSYDTTDFLQKPWEPSLDIDSYSGISSYINNNYSKSYRDENWSYNGATYTGSLNSLSFYQSESRGGNNTNSESSNSNVGAGSSGGGNANIPAAIETHY